MSTTELQKKIRSVRDAERGIHPDAAWVSRTRETLLMQVQNTLPVRLDRESKMASLFHALIPTRVVVWLRGPVLAVISIFSLVAGGSIASVSAAERSIPGDLLYSLKLATEQTRLALTKGRTDRLKLKTEFVDRRVAEIKNIVSSDVSGKPARIQEAAEILKRDLDTVKVQLNEVSQSESAHQTAQAAKLIDQKSTELVTTLKDVRTSLPQDVQAKVTEAEVAAVSTGVKAVQVLIDSQSKPEAAGVVTHEELVQSIHAKVQGLEENIADATQKIVAANSAVSTTNSLLNSSTTTGMVARNDAASSSAALSLTQIESAQQSLSQAKQLLQEQKLSEVSDKLAETVKVVATVETTANAATDAVATAAGTASSTPVVLPISSTGTQPTLGASSSSTVMPSRTATSSLPAVTGTSTVVGGASTSTAEKK